jgi:uncharacterized protein
MTDKKLCIYHGNCADGFGAAWVVRKALGEDNVEFVAGVYPQEPPDVTGRDVILVDFSYKRAIIIEMAKKAKSITIIDHHKSAMEDLVNVDVACMGSGCNMTITFDMNHSGAMLSWIFFNGDAAPPQLLRHIEDRDLWLFHLAGTREIQAALFSYPYDFKVWDRLMASNVVELFNDGAVIERKHFKDIEELLKVCQRRLKIGGCEVPAASLPYTMSSDAGNIMGKDEVFAACYYDTQAGRCFSLRSAEDGMDVSVIAKLYGGGGHKHAAGFTVPLDVAMSFELDTVDGAKLDLTNEIRLAVRDKPDGVYDYRAKIHKREGADLRLSNSMLTGGSVSNE